MNEVLQQLRQAEQNFNYADEFHVDEAIKQMNEAREKFTKMLEKKRGSINEN